MPYSITNAHGLRSEAGSHLGSGPHPPVKMRSCRWQWKSLAAARTEISFDVLLCSGQSFRWEPLQQSALASDSGAPRSPGTVATLLSSGSSPAAPTCHTATPMASATPAKHEGATAVWRGVIGQHVVDVKHADDGVAMYKVMASADEAADTAAGQDAIHALIHRPASACSPPPSSWACQWLRHRLHTKSLHSPQFDCAQSI